MRKRRFLYDWLIEIQEKLREDPGHPLSEYWRGQIFGIMLAMGEPLEDIHKLLEELPARGDAAQLAAGNCCPQKSEGI